MPNQHTTVQRIRNFIAEENFIADFSYNSLKHLFRLVYRTHSGVDMLVYIVPKTDYGKGWVLYASFTGVADFNRKYHNGVHFRVRDPLISDMQRRSTLSLAKQCLTSYARRYTRPAYYNVDGTTKCKYTQEQLDNKEF